MSAATPSDLAVTFRSLGRRRREAIGDADPAMVSALTAQLDAAVARAAALLGVAADADTVATTIASRPVDDWDDATLGSLRTAALDAGGVLRRIGDAVAAADQD